MPVNMYIYALIQSRKKYIVGLVASNHQEEQHIVVRLLYMSKQQGAKSLLRPATAALCVTFQRKESGRFQQPSALRYETIHKVSCRQSSSSNVYVSDALRGTNRQPPKLQFGTHKFVSKATVYSSSAYLGISFLSGKGGDSRKHMYVPAAQPLIVIITLYFVPHVCFSSSLNLSSHFTHVINVIFSQIVEKFKLSWLLSTTITRWNIKSKFKYNFFQHLLQPC